MMIFQKTFRTALIQKQLFYTKTALGDCLYNFNLTLMITSNIFYKMCIQILKKLYVKETFHLQGEYSLIIYICCYDFEGT